MKFSQTQKNNLTDVGDGNSPSLENMLPKTGFIEAAKSDGEVYFSPNAKSNSVAELSPLIRDYISGYIALADAKAGVLIGVYTGLLTAAIAKGKYILEIPLAEWVLFDWSVMLSWVTFVIGIASALLAVWPRTSAVSHLGLVSWVHIANYPTGEDYVKDFASSSGDKIYAQLCALNYDLSMICKRKYCWMARSFKYGLVGALCFGLFLVYHYLL